MSTMPKPRYRASRAQRCSMILPVPPLDQLRHARWLELAGAELQAQGPVVITGPAALRVRAGLPERPRDLTVLGLALRDLLVAHGVIAGHIAVVDLDLAWDRTVPGNCCSVELWRTSAPHQRITAESRRRLSATVSQRWADARAGKATAA